MGKITSVYTYVYIVGKIVKHVVDKILCYTKS